MNANFPKRDSGLAPKSRCRRARSTIETLSGPECSTAWSSVPAPAIRRSLASTSHGRRSLRNRKHPHHDEIAQSAGAVIRVTREVSNACAGLLGCSPHLAPGGQRDQRQQPHHPAAIAIRRFCECAHYKRIEQEREHDGDEKFQRQPSAVSRQQDCDWKTAENAEDDDLPVKPYQRGKDE